jgi:hypothetical protein
VRNHTFLLPTTATTSRYFLYGDSTTSDGWIVIRSSANLIETLLRSSHGFGTQQQSLVKSLHLPQTLTGRLPGSHAREQARKVSATGNSFNASHNLTKAYPTADRLFRICTFQGGGAASSYAEAMYRIHHLAHAVRTPVPIVSLQESRILSRPRVNIALEWGYSCERSRMVRGTVRKAAKHAR